MDTIHTYLSILFILLLVALSAYFSTIETSMMALNPYRLKHLARSGHRGAQRIEQLVASPDKLLSLALIGSTLVNTSASALGTLLGLKLYGDKGMLIAGTVLTAIILIFGEVLPKTIAAFYPERSALLTSLLLPPLLSIGKPIIWSLNRFTNWFTKLFGISLDASRRTTRLSKGEFETLLKENPALLHTIDKTLLLKLLRLGELPVEAVMLPRTQIPCINIQATWQEIHAVLAQAIASEVLLYREKLDEVVGILDARSAYAIRMAPSLHQKSALIHLADHPTRIKKGTPLKQQLLLFQTQGKRAALVIDADGAISGLISMEVILSKFLKPIQETKLLSNSWTASVQKEHVL